MPGSPVADFTLDSADMLVLSDELTELGFDDLLSREAARQSLLPAEQLEPVEEAIDMSVPGWATRLILEEGVVGYIKAQFEKDHPRWPAGAPGGKGGEFVKIGERFVGADGKRYEIEAIHGAKVIAVSASGNPADVKELVLNTKGGKMPTQPAPPAKISGDKEHGVNVPGAVTISPFVEPSTHDPSIPKPASLHISDEEWARFGKEDQEHFLYVEQRFGAWSPDKSKKLISEIQKQYDGAIQQVVSSALSSQYGSSSGFTLSLAQLFNHVSGDPTALKAAQARYETAKLLLRDTAEAIQWDLYHRTKSPDVTTFHWGNNSEVQQKKYHLQQGVPILAAYSNSTGFTTTIGFGDTVTAIPLAIRHVEMHTWSGGVYADYQSEYEITTGARLKLDDRALFADYYSMPPDVKAYLAKMAKDGGEPASGAIVYEAKKALKDAGYDLPLPPEKPEVSPMPVAGEIAGQYDELEPEVAQKAGAMIFDLPYSGGSAEAAQGTLELLGVKPGDFLEGMKGTRYIVIDDAADPTSGLRYVKIEPESKQPNYAKSWPFNASQGQPFKRLEGHLDIPAKKVKKGGFVPYTQAQYDQLAKGPKTKVYAMDVGAIFMADGIGYQVIGPHSGGKVQAKSLKDGKSYLINGGYKPEVLGKPGSFKEPEPGDVIEDDPVAAPKEWKVGDKVLLNAWGNSSQLGTIVASEGDGWKVQTANDPDGTLYISSFLFEPPKQPGIDQGSNYAELALKLEKGDKFAWDGESFTVTTVLKSGTVKAKGKDGKVHGFPVSSLYGNAVFYRPSTWAIGNKAKVKDLDVGDVVQGGAGAKIRPYVLEGKLGNKAWLRNLETGELVKVTPNKQYARLLDANEIAAAAQPGPAAPVVPLVEGPKKPIKSLEVGDAWKAMNNKDAPHHYVMADKNDKSFFVQKVITETGQPDGDPLEISWDVMSDDDKLFTTLVPASEAQKAAKPELNTKFDESKYAKGDSVMLKDLEPGSLFYSATGLVMQLKSNKPKGGATAVALHNGKTVKNISYEKPYVSLIEKDEVPFDHANLAPGDDVKAAALEVGDKFGKPYGTAIYVVVGDPKAPDQKLHAEVLLPDTGKTVPAASSFYPQSDVVYLGTHEAATSKPGPASDIHADALPLAPGYETYLHPKAGKYKYPKVSQMPVGTVFTDKSGQAWKVKQQGGQTVVSAGNDLAPAGTLYKIDSSWRGKVVEEGDGVAFVDDPASPGDPGGKITIGLLVKGDKFTVPEGYQDAGAQFVVTDDFQQQKSGYKTIKASKLGSGGKEQDISTTLEAKNVVTADQDQGAPDDVPPWEQEPALPVSEEVAAVLEKFPPGTVVKWMYEYEVVGASHNGQKVMLKATSGTLITQSSDAFSSPTMEVLSSPSPEGIPAKIGEPVSLSGVKVGDKVAFSQMPVGALFKGKMGGQFKVVEHEGKPAAVYDSGFGEATAEAAGGEMETDPSFAYEILSLPKPGAASEPGSHWKVTGQWTTKAYMDKFDFGETESGALVYKGLDDKLFELGKKDEYEPSWVNALKKVEWAGPSAHASELEPIGGKKPLSALRAGDFFEAPNGKKYQVLANGDEGITGMAMWSGHVGFQPHVGAPLVQPLGEKPKTWDTFTSIPVGAYFKSDGGTWQKIKAATSGGGFGAKLIDKHDPMQLADEGEVVPWYDEGGEVEVIDLPDDPKPKDEFFEQLADGDKATYLPNGDQVTVTNNQIGGLGVEITFPNGTVGVGLPGDLGPPLSPGQPQTVKAADLPVGAKFLNTKTLFSGWPEDAVLTVQKKTPGWIHVTSDGGESTQFAPTSAVGSTPVTAVGADEPGPPEQSSTLPAIATVPWEPNTVGLDVGELPVGALYTAPGDGKIVKVTAKTDDMMTLQYADAAGELDANDTPSEYPLYHGEVGAKPEQYKLPPTAAGTTIGDLGVGDKFMFPPDDDENGPEELGFFTVESVVGHVVHASYTKPDGEKVLKLSGDSETVPMVKLDAPVVKLDEAGFPMEPSPLSPGVQVGDKIENFDQLNVGDEYEIPGYGSPIKVVGKEPDGSTIVEGPPGEKDTYPPGHPFGGKEAVTLTKKAGAREFKPGQKVKWSAGHGEYLEGTVMYAPGPTEVPPGHVKVTTGAGVMTPHAKLLTVVEPDADEDSPQSFNKPVKFGHLQKGSLFKTPDGQMWTVGGPSGSGPGWGEPVGGGAKKKFYLSSSVLGLGPSEPESDYAPGTKAWAVGTDWNGAEVEIVGSVAGSEQTAYDVKRTKDGQVGILNHDELSLEPPKPPIDTNPLSPYLHAKSGKYKYPKLLELDAGTRFRDKKGDLYEVVGHTSNGYTTFESLETGTQFSAKSGLHVKVVPTDT